VAEQHVEVVSYFQEHGARLKLPPSQLAFAEKFAVKAPRKFSGRKVSARK